MRAFVDGAVYEALTPTSGRLRVRVVELVEAPAVFAELTSRRERGRRHSRRREIVLNVTSNIPDFTGLMPGELELILPVVTRLLDQLSKEAGPGGTHEEAVTKQEG